MEPSPDIDIAVERDPYIVMSLAINGGLNSLSTFGLWKIAPPLARSFSSVTDSCSKRDSIALIAILKKIPWSMLGASVIS